MTVTHTTFTLERTYAAAPPRVFAAWSDPDTKGRWFATGHTHRLDFRPGGQEVTRGRAPDGKEMAFTSVYHDIVPDERIVYSSTLTGDDELATVSTTTVEFSADGEGTRLILTEQSTFLEDRELPDWREQGTSDWLAKLGKELAS
ncbi:SRPBCC family protein [Streptomyces sp. NPDC006923]|uniref:SRPBCC family protein n=1 Tax=Streptomyces sp. NPDC006923 TaxID=3155355 RepID=UPI0033F6937E